MQMHLLLFMLIKKGIVTHNLLFSLLFYLICPVPSFWWTATGDRR